MTIVWRFIAIASVGLTTTWRAIRVKVTLRELAERTRNVKLPPANPRAAELALIRSVADDVVTRVMKEGEATHAVGEWREVGDVNHFNHAADHMTTYSLTNMDGIEDIEHAIVRLVFIVAKAKQKEDGK